MPARKRIPTMRIGVDQREKLPFEFRDIEPRGINFSVESCHIETGDYTIVNDNPLIAVPMSDQIVIERKSLNDLYHTISGDEFRERFEREFKRMAEYGYAAVIVEQGWEAIRFPNNHLNYATNMNPKSVIGTLLAWSQRYGVHIMPCPTRQWAEAIAYRMLERWFKDKVLNKEEIEAVRTTRY